MEEVPVYESGADAKPDTRPKTPSVGRDGMVRGNTIFGTFLKLLAFLVLVAGGIFGFVTASASTQNGITQQPVWLLAYPIWAMAVGVAIVLYFMGQVLMLLYHIREFMWLSDKSQE